MDGGGRRRGAHGELPPLLPELFDGALVAEVFEEEVS